MPPFVLIKFASARFALFSLFTSIEERDSFHNAVYITFIVYLLSLNMLEFPVLFA
jgi:hypothetical protein